jgi:hypothetical protein
MKRILCSTVLVLLFAAPAGATYVNFELSYRFDATSGVYYILQCFDARTGVLLLSESPVQPNVEYRLRIPRENHDKILCTVKAAGGPTVGIWRIYPKRYYQGCGGKIKADLPSDPGTCGDGAITGVEACDTSGNKGCTPGSATPRCCRCEYCGCATAADCPQITAPPCGYGRCSPQERPVFSVTCYDCGICLYPYRCVADPACADAAENPVETKEAAVCTDRDAVHGALGPGQAGIYFTSGLGVQVANPGSSLVVNGEPLPGPAEPDQAYVMGGVVVGIQEAPPPHLGFWLTGPGNVWSEAEDWLAEDGAVDLDGQGNSPCLAGFLEGVLARVRRLRPLERVNLEMPGEAVHRATARSGEVNRLQEGFFASPSLTVRTDRETLELVLEERLTIRQAMREGRITVTR